MVAGGGSCTHGGKAYEAHLNLILPAVKLVESVGNAPTSTCLQGRCIPCLPRPQEILASRPGAAPGRLSFGDSAAQAGARLVEIKRAGSILALPARALAEPTLGEGLAFQQRTNTSWRSMRSQPAVSRRLFRCLGGTPPAKPFNCKIWSKRPGARFGDQWAHHID